MTRLVKPDGRPDRGTALCYACSGTADRSPVSESFTLVRVSRDPLPNHALLDQAAPLRGAASGAPRAGLSLERAARCARAVRLGRGLTALTIGRCHANVNIRAPVSFSTTLGCGWQASEGQFRAGLRAAALGRAFIQKLINVVSIFKVVIS